METHYRRAMAERVPLSFEASSPIAERWLDVRLFPTADGIAAFLLDIHVRKMAEEKLRESERRERERAVELAALLDAVPTPVLIAHDPDCLHITGNHAADDLLRNPRGAEASLSAPVETKPRYFKAIKDGRELKNEELPAQRARAVFR